MIYKIENNSIYVFDKTQFNIKHILECGQVFRFGKNNDGSYYVISKDKKADIYENENCYLIKSTDPYYFVNYFDLNTDYNKIKELLKSDELLKPMIDYGYGIRILNADNYEMILSFIISQNNNIKRIQKIIEKLCEAGTKINNFYAFPSIQELKLKDESFFSNLGAGYRDKYLISAINYLEKINFDNLKSLSSEDLFKHLLSIKGIGQKVASCILLFGFKRMDYFPVDTWIEQVYYNHFSNEKKSRPQIQKFFEDKYKNLSGIAQQYLFYYERNKK